ncbi:MAG: hypothetical protein ABI437_10155, partial [Kofleriaceae bacterium]
MLRALQNVIHVGEGFATGARSKRRVVVNNTLAIIVAFNTWSYFVPLWSLGLKLLALSLIPVGLLFLLPIVLNRAGLLAASRVVFLSLPAPIAFIYFCALGLRGEVSLFYATACVPLLLCSLADRKSVIYGIVLAIGLALTLFLCGDVVVGPPLLSPHSEFVLRTILVVGTFAILLIIVRSFVVSNARAEQQLEVAYAGSQRLLDSVDQGFVTLDPKGRLEVQRSGVFDTWFGAPAAGTLFAECLHGLSSSVGESFAMGWSQLEDGLLPIDLLLEQLPASTTASSRRTSARPPASRGARAS